MRASAWFAAAAVAAVALSLGLLTRPAPVDAAPGGGVPPEAAAAGYQKLIFSDDFNSLDLSPDGGGSHKWFNNAFILPPVPVRLFSLANGVLTLTTPDTRAEVPTSTSLQTLKRAPSGTSTLFHYGYFEARMRFTPSSYNWPAFWLESAERPAFDERIGKGSWCELDIFEGGRPDFFQGTVHNWQDFKDSDNPNQHFRLPLGTSLTQWNRYGVLWQPGKITWFFNGRALGSAPSPSVCDQQQMFLLLGAQRRAGSTEKTTLDVDWVHIYR